MELNQGVMVPFPFFSEWHWGLRRGNVARSYDYTDMVTCTDLFRFGFTPCAPGNAAGKAAFGTEGLNGTALVGEDWDEIAGEREGERQRWREGGRVGGRDGGRRGGREEESLGAFISATNYS